MIFFNKRSEKYGRLLAKDSTLDDDLNAILVNADRLADAVIQNVDDWAEGRAFAYALRLSLAKYRRAKQHIHNEAPK